MSFYQKMAQLGQKFIPQHTLFKYGFNFSPMYRRSTAKIVSVSSNLKNISIKLPLNWKNRNYVNTIFGGSMFAAVDPIPMVQLMYLLGKNYVVWDKSANIQFKRPGNQNLYAVFTYTQEEVDFIKKSVENHNEVEIVKTTQLTNKRQDKVFCVVDKTIYIASKTYYKQKQQKRRQKAK